MVLVLKTDINIPQETLITRSPSHREPLRMLSSLLGTRGEWTSGARKSPGPREEPWLKGH